MIVLMTDQPRRALSWPGRTLKHASLRAFDLFPHTHHLEALAVFRRVG